jgi:small subunit ribosomal protein S16
MLSIRMQRTGRKGHAMFRLVVQESRYTPTSGKVVAQLGSFDPHTKTARVDSEKASFYLTHGAQPSGRAAILLQKEGVELPKWVKLSGAKTGKIRNADKLRRNQPKDEAKDEAPAAEPAQAPADAAPADAPEAETGTTES